MTISTTIRKAGPYTTNGSTTVFSFPFKLFSTSEIQVIKADTLTVTETVLTLGVDYTASLNSNQDASPGGSITISPAIQSGYTITILSNVSLTQSVALANQGGFYPDVINAALDRLTIFAQQLQDKLSRKVGLKDSETENLVMPTPAPNMLIGYNVTGDGLAAYPFSTTNLMSLTAATDTGAVNAYVVTIPEMPSGYYNGMRVLFKTANTNTANAPTLNVNGFGAITITEPNGKLVVINQLPANTVIEVVYNSTGPRFELVNLTLPSMPEVAYSNATTLTSADINKTVTLSGTTYTVTMPDATTGKDGSRIIIRSVASGDIILQRAGTNTLSPGNATSYTIKQNDVLEFVCRASGVWLCVNSTGIPLIYSETWKQLQGYGSFNSLTSGVTFTQADAGKLNYYNSGSAGSCTLPNSLSVNGQSIFISNLGAGLLTVNRSGTAGIYAQGQTGVTSIQLYQGMSVTLTWDGGNWIQKYGFTHYTGSTTPTVTATSGSGYTFSCTLKYVRIGNLCYYDADITCSVLGTAAGGLVIPLPFTAAGTTRKTAVGMNYSASLALAGTIVAGGTSVTAYKYDGGFPFSGATQYASISGVFEVA